MSREDVFDRMLMQLVFEEAGNWGAAGLVYKPGAGSRMQPSLESGGRCLELRVGMKKDGVVEKWLRKKPRIQT